MARARITGKQRVARKKNIAIARRSKKKGAGKGKKPSAAAIKANTVAGRGGARKKKITQMRENIKARKSTGRKKAEKSATNKGQAGAAFKKSYKKTAIDKHVSKSYARRVAHTAAIKANKVGGTSLAKKFAMGLAKKQGYDLKGAKQFTSGYLKSIMSDIRRGG